MIRSRIFFILGVIVTVTLALAAIWLLFFRTSTQNQSSQTSTGFGYSQTFRQSTDPQTGSGSQENSSLSQTQGSDSQKMIFLISNDPVVSSVFVQTSNPTTTVSRYMLQGNGHIFDMSLDTPGAVARVVSSVTIPGVVSALWTKSGTQVLVQFIDSGNIRTALLTTLPPSTTSATTTIGTRVQFLPNNIRSMALSPDDKQVLYVFTGNTGATGYVANIDGTKSRKVFSIPLSQITVSWPTQDSVLIQTKPASSAPGMIFSVNLKTSALLPLVSALGISALANNALSHMLYHFNDATGKQVAYVRNMQTGKNVQLPTYFLPEKCAWDSTTGTRLYCAIPSQPISNNYFDLWRQGLVSTGDDILRYSTGKEPQIFIAHPGYVSLGGIAADIVQLSVSQDNHYLQYISKGDRTLWGVRLTQ